MRSSHWRPARASFYVPSGWRLCASPNACRLTVATPENASTVVNFTCALDGAHASGDAARAAS